MSSFNKASVRVIIGVILAALVANLSFAQAKRSAKKTAGKKTKIQRPANASSSSRSSSIGEGDFQEAMRLVRAGQYQQASARLFQLSLSPKYADRRTQLRYLLGLMLYQMKMNQLAAFQFISVVREGNSRFLGDGLEKLSLAADALGDDALLNYAIARVKSDNFPAAHRDMLFYRIGEFQLRNQQYDEAIRSFVKVPNNSTVFDKALYLKAYAHAASNNPKAAVADFDALLEVKSDASVTDPTRVAALMGKARALYQQKEWDAAIEAYREVPRDTALWHDTLFEISWAMLRSGKFRSALSQFQSLHSPYYEEAYLPESLLLRSIVYLYICQYDEMAKVLDLFNKIYRPLYKNVDVYLNSVKNPVTYFNDVVRSIRENEELGKSTKTKKAKSNLPQLVVQKVTKEGDFQRSFQYIKKLIEEKRKIMAMPASWRTSSLGKYARQTIDRRLQRARLKAGRQVRAHMISMRTELIDFFEQEGFIRYEMTNGRKEQLKKRVAGKELPKAQINEDEERDTYVQNGYQYWAFRGEYWLDEIDNFHYVGTQSCE
ncbi:MAG: tetratricopeptide repeat protein [Bdellovibrionota bacterium]